jgi:small-conductance mechanosensitive channel
MNIDELQSLLEISIGKLFVGWLLVLIGLIIKDTFSNGILGLIFYLNRSYNEGDVVYIDNEKLIIQKIGIRQTVFKVVGSEGRWRYISNQKINYLVIEKDLEYKLGDTNGKDKTE